MANIDRGFNVDILSLSDRTLITSGIADPRIAGYEAPDGSLFAYKNGTNSILLIKKGTLNTDWVAVEQSSTTTSHTALADRELDNQHPISAITGLLAALDAKVDVNGDVMTGSLGLPSTKGEGLLIESGYSWVDLIGPISPRTLGTSSAMLYPFNEQTTGWAHRAGSEGDLTYHVPHDYAPNTDTFIHVHWGHNGTDIQGTLKLKLYVSIAKRTYPATPFSAPIMIPLEITGLNITNSPRWAHRVDEVALSTVSGTGGTLLNSLIETDGLIQVHYEVDTIPSISGSTEVNLPYIQTIDIHMQSTSIGTKNKDPDFWS